MLLYFSLPNNNKSCSIGCKPALSEPGDSLQGSLLPCFVESK